MTKKKNDDARADADVAARIVDRHARLHNPAMIGASRFIRPSLRRPASGAPPLPATGPSIFGRPPSRTSRRLAPARIEWRCAMSDDRRTAVHRHRQRLDQRGLAFARRGTRWARRGPAAPACRRAREPARRAAPGRTTAPARAGRAACHSPSGSLRISSCTPAALAASTASASMSSPFEPSEKREMFSLIVPSNRLGSCGR